MSHSVPNPFGPDDASKRGATLARNVSTLRPIQAPPHSGTPQGSANGIPSNPFSPPPPTAVSPSGGAAQASPARPGWVAFGAGVPAEVTHSSPHSVPNSALSLNRAPDASMTQEEQVPHNPFLSLCERDAGPRARRESGSTYPFEALAQSHVLPARPTISRRPEGLGSSQAGTAPSTVYPMNGGALAPAPPAPRKPSGSISQAFPASPVAAMSNSESDLAKSVSELSVAARRDMFEQQGKQVVQPPMPTSTRPKTLAHPPISSSPSASVSAESAIVPPNPFASPPAPPAAHLPLSVGLAPPIVMPSAPPPVPPRPSACLAAKANAVMTWTDSHSMLELNTNAPAQQQQQAQPDFLTSARPVGHARSLSSQFLGPTVPQVGSPAVAQKPPPPLPSRPPVGAPLQPLHVPCGAGTSVAGGSSSSGRTTPAALPTAGHSTVQLVHPVADLANHHAPRVPGCEDIILTSAKLSNASVRAAVVHGSIVVTGHKDITRIHHLYSGRLISTLAHPDLKVTAMAWRPSHIRAETGCILWIGFQNGDIWTVDVVGKSKPPQSRVASYMATCMHTGPLDGLPGGLTACATPVVLERKKVSARGKRIVHILQHRMQLWVIDDDNVFSVFECPAYSTVTGSGGQLPGGDPGRLPSRQPFVCGQPAVSLEAKTAASYRFAPANPMASANPNAAPTLVGTAPSFSGGMSTGSLFDSSSLSVGTTTSSGTSVTASATTTVQTTLPPEESDMPSIVTLTMCGEVPLLWITHAKFPRVIDVFNPTMHSSYGFVVGSALVPTGVGSITCLAPSPPPGKDEFDPDPAHGAESGWVISGHDDGKLVVWDAATRNALHVVAASPYRITCVLLPRPGFVWVGLVTSKVLVFRIQPRANGSQDFPYLYDWVLTKGFYPHTADKGRITRLVPHTRMHLPALCDPSETSLVAVHTVASVAVWGDGSVVTLLDADLLDDWLSAQFIRRERQYAGYNDLHVLVCSWNLDACSPRDVIEQATGMRITMKKTGSGELAGLMGSGHDLDNTALAAHGGSGSGTVGVANTARVAPAIPPPPAAGKSTTEFVSRLEDWVGQAIKRTGHAPEVIVVGFQETVNLEDKKKQARTFLRSKKSKNPNATAHEKQHKLWQEAIAEAVRAVHAPAGVVYRAFVAQYMVGLAALVFVRGDLASRVDLVDVQQIKTGMKGYHGNKGALVARLCIDDSSLCFVVAHLAAGQDDLSARNKNAHAILDGPCFQTTGDKFVYGADGRHVHDHHHIWFIGDLNYRIDMDREKLVSLLEDVQGRQGGPGARLPVPSATATMDSSRSLYNEAHKVHQTAVSLWQSVWAHDQLVKMRRVSRHMGHAFALASFSEAPLGFTPTYKYDVGSDVWDSSDKQRAPAWCDRILFRSAACEVPPSALLDPDLDRHLTPPDPAGIPGAGVDDPWFHPDAFGFVPLLPASPSWSASAAAAAQAVLQSRGLACLAYSRMEAQVSDHRPIYGLYLARVKREDATARMRLRNVLLAAAHARMRGVWAAAIATRARHLGFHPTVIDHALRTLGDAGPAREPELWDLLWEEQVRARGLLVDPPA